MKSKKNVPRVSLIAQKFNKEYTLLKKIHSMKTKRKLPQKLFISKSSTILLLKSILILEYGEAEMQKLYRGFN
jgi:hypothetical protein